jgi:hypothetical protein
LTWNNAGRNLTVQVAYFPTKELCEDGLKMLSDTGLMSRPGELE